MRIETALFAKRHFIPSSGRVLWNAMVKGFGRDGIAAGWFRRLSLLLAVVLSIFPAFSLAAAAHGYDIGPAGHAHMHGAPGHADEFGPHHHARPVQQHAGIAASTPVGCAAGHHPMYNGNCCDACQIAVGLLVTAAEPALLPRGMSAVRLSDVTPPGQPPSAPAEPPRS